MRLPERTFSTREKNTSRSAYVGQDDVPNDYEKISYMRDSYLDIIQRFNIFPIICKNKGSNKIG